MINIYPHLNRKTQKNRLGIYFHIQGTNPIEDNLDLVDLYKALGVGVIQLTYNLKNRVGVAALGAPLFSAKGR